MSVFRKRQRFHNTSSTTSIITIRSKQAGKSQYHGIVNFSNYPFHAETSNTQPALFCPEKVQQNFASHFSCNCNYYPLFTNTTTIRRVA